MVKKNIGFRGVVQDPDFFLFPAGSAPTGIRKKLGARTGRRSENIMVPDNPDGNDAFICPGMFMKFHFLTNFLNKFKLLGRKHIFFKAESA